MFVVHKMSYKGNPKNLVKYKTMIDARKAAIDKMKKEGLKGKGYLDDDSTYVVRKYVDGRYGVVGWVTMGWQQDVKARFSMPFFVFLAGGHGSFSDPILLDSNGKTMRRL